MRTFALLLRSVAGSLLVLGCVLALAGPASAASAGVFSWGENEVGQLGNGTTTDSEVPVPVGGGSDVTALAGGRRHSLALLSDGSVLAWGENDWGQLGDGNGTGPETCNAAYAAGSGYEVPCSTTPVAVSGLSGVVAIAAGAQHSLALLSNGTVMAWGDNETGQLGDGTTSGPDHCYTEKEPTQCSTSPVLVSGLSEVTAIAAGQNFNLALLKNGTVMAWGSNGQGELGNGGSSWADASPALVSGLSGVTAIAAGGDDGLAILGNGTVMAWGSNEFGQLGDGALTQSDVPVAVSGVSDVSAVAIGAASLALRDDGTVMAWGSNISGQLGDGTHAGPTECFPLNFCSATPVEVHGLEHVTAITAGGGQSLALLSNGAVMAWGLNWEGQLGDGTRESSDVPTAVRGLGQVTAIAGAGEFSLAYGVPGAAPPDEEAPPRNEAPSTATTDGPPSTSVGADGSSLSRDATSLFPNLAAATGHAQLTRAQKLAKALRACKRRPKNQQATCERQAHRRYRTPASGKNA